MRELTLTDVYIDWYLAKYVTKKRWKDSTFGEYVDYIKQWFVIV